MRGIGNLPKSYHFGKAVDLMDKVGIKPAVKQHKDLFASLGKYEVKQLINSFGVYTLEAFHDAGMLKRFSGWDLQSTIVDLGLDSLGKFRSLGLLEKLKARDIAQIVKTLGLDSLESISENGLVEAVSPHALMLVMHFGLDSLDKMKEFGLIKNFGADQAKFLMNHFGLDAIPYMLDFGLSFPEIMGNDGTQKNADLIMNSGILDLKDEDGFSFGYHFFQSPVGKKELFSHDLNAFIPGDKGVIHDFLYNFYYHDKSFDNKIALIFQGPDHNSAMLETYMPHLLYQKGYNVLVVDGRIFGEQCALQELKYNSIQNFADSENIPLKEKLDFIGVYAHGGEEYYGHIILVPEVKYAMKNSSGHDVYGVSCEKVTTSELISEVTKDIEQPLKVMMTSCYSWAAVDDTMPFLPEGSEMLVFGRNRNFGINNVQSNGPDQDKIFERNFLKADYLNVFDGNSISAKDMTLIASLKVGLETYKQSNAFYSQKNAIGHTNVICEEEGAVAKSKCHEDSIISRFVDRICVKDESCEQKYSTILHESLNSEDVVTHVSHEAQNAINTFGCWLAFEDLV